MATPGLTIEVTEDGKLICKIGKKTYDTDTRAKARKLMAELEKMGQSAEKCTVKKTAETNTNTAQAERIAS